MRKNSQFLPLHKAFKRGFAKRNHRFLVAPEFGVIGIRFGPYRMGVRQLGIQPDGLFKAALITSAGKGLRRAPAATSCLRAVGFLVNVQFKLSAALPSGMLSGTKPRRSVGVEGLGKAGRQAPANGLLGMHCGRCPCR